MGAILSNFYKSVTTAGVRVVLGASTVQFNTGTLIAVRSATEENTGRVYLARAAAGGGVEEVWPGASLMIAKERATILDASQFWLDAEVSGDGVLFVHGLADWKAFNDIESKVETAILRYLLTIGATLDDCSFTTGISADERTEDNVNVHCDAADERIQQSGNWDASVTVQVRSQVGKSGENNRLDLHRLRTAYVRDLLMEPEAEDIIASLYNGLAVYANSIRDLHSENRVDGRQWLADLTFKMTVHGSNLL